jgi:hypothetical protein
VQQVDALQMRTHVQQPVAMVWLTTRSLSSHGPQRIVDAAAAQLGVPVVAFAADQVDHRDELARIGGFAAPCLLVFARGELWDRLLIRDVDDLVAAVTPLLKRIRR